MEIALGEVSELTKQNESAEVVKGRILKVAASLFAENGVKAVTIRRIAADAGINHALIIRYFGSKDNLVTEILHRQISVLTALPPAQAGSDPYTTLANLRKHLQSALTNDQNTMRLIMRAGLDGLAPEQYIDPTRERAANLIAKWIKSQQTDPTLPDAKLVSIIVTGMIFSLVSITPWLMTAVNLPNDDMERQQAGIIDTAVWMIGQAIGLPPKQETPSAPDAFPSR